MSNEKSAQELADSFAALERRINARLEKGDARMSRIETNLQITLGTIKEDIGTMKEVMQAWQAAGFIGRAAMWIVSIAGAVALLVQAVRGKLF